VQTKLRLLVASINFAPDHAGIANYSTDLAVFLAEKGHSVTMLTGFSYYPLWSKRSEDRRRFFARERYRGIDVIRGYLYVPSRPSSFKRLLHEISFCFFALLNGFRCGKQDLVVAITPPLFLAIVARFLAWCWQCPVITHVQDLPLDAAQDLGMVKKGLAMRGMFAIERWLYQRSSAVITLSDGMQQKILSKGVPVEKTVIVPNWIDLESQVKATPCEEFLNRCPLVRDRLIVAYAGNIGKKQGVDVLVDLAVRASGNTRFYFYIVGDGADRPRLEQIVRGKKLSNLEFRPFLGVADYRRFLDLIDIVFVAQRSGVGNIFFPSKLLGIMAQRKPLLVSADLDSELGQVIQRSNAGIVVPFGDIGALEHVLSVVQADQRCLGTMGENGWKQVQLFDRKVVLSRYEETMRTLVRRNVFQRTNPARKSLE